MDKHDIKIGLIAAIIGTLIIIFLLYPIWGIFLTIKITSISIIPNIMWWLIYGLLTILWWKLIILSYIELEKTSKEF
ncbi:MAG: hypothetical protein ACOCP8_01200 [archaeon]